jgi:hypothetical protein
MISFQLLFWQEQAVRSAPVLVCLPSPPLGSYLGKFDWVIDLKNMLATDGKRDRSTGNPLRTDMNEIGPMGWVFRSSDVEGASSWLESLVVHGFS